MSIGSIIGSITGNIMTQKQHQCGFTNTFQHYDYIGFSKKGPELATFAELFDLVYSNAKIYKWAMKFEV